jgi:hypothetical protein
VGLVLNDIYDHKFHQGHANADLPNSHNGATRATLTLSDLQLLGKGLADVSGNDSTGKPYISNEARAFIKAELGYRVAKFTSHLDKVQDQILKAIPDNSPYKVKDPAHPLAPKNINYGAIIADLKSSDVKTREAAAQAAVIIKAAGVEFADTQGRNFALSDLGKIGKELGLDSDLNRTLTALATLADTYSPEIDDATLEWLVQENRKATSHPRVGIVGGGPTGLFAGLEFFAKGGDVKISESRDALYSRHQIVRLDPLWVNKLKFYLGTDFEKYYGAEDKAYAGQSKPKIGNRSGDGFVETVINHLEDRLLDRVVLLNSLAESKPPITIVAPEVKVTTLDTKLPEIFQFALIDELESYEKAHVSKLNDREKQVIYTCISDLRSPNPQFHLIHARLNSVDDFRAENGLLSRFRFPGIDNSVDQTPNTGPKTVKPGISILAAHEVKPKLESKDGEPFVLRSVFKADAEDIKTELEEVGRDAKGQAIYQEHLIGGQSDPYQFTIVEKVAAPDASGVQSIIRSKEYILDPVTNERVKRIASEADNSYRADQEIPVDIVFDCAGKHSPFKEGNTISRDVTTSEPHIVASFFVRGECLSYRQENHDFRRQYLINNDFIAKADKGVEQSIGSYLQKLEDEHGAGPFPFGEGKNQVILSQSQFGSFTEKVKNASNALRTQYITKDTDAYARIPVQDGIRKNPNDPEGEKSLVYETRTFVNTSNDFQEAAGAKPRKDGGVARQADGQDRPDNIVYLGLELPKPIDAFQNALKAQLLNDLKAEFPNSKALTQVVNAIVGEANLGFVLAVANEQGLDRPRTDAPESEPWVNADNADRKFLGAFPVSQGSVPNGVLVRKAANGRVLIQASGGDSAASPHFMRYSGLSGAREHVGIISKIVGQAASSAGPLSESEAEKQIAFANKNYASINEFVLSRGKVFLESATPLQIAQNVRQDLDRLLSNTDHDNKPKANIFDNLNGATQNAKQLEAGAILRHQLKEDIEKSKADGVDPATKAVWDGIDTIIGQLETGTYAG